MRIRVDTTLCVGHALCAAREPEVYGLDEQGFCSADGASVPQGLEERARRGASQCPEGAITLWEEDATR
jgi:ferredoxin